MSKLGIVTVNLPVMFFDGHFYNRQQLTPLSEAISAARR
jgi:hypothetical protein